MYYFVEFEGYCIIEANNKEEAEENLYKEIDSIHFKKVDNINFNRVIASREVENV